MHTRAKKKQPQRLCAFKGFETTPEHLSGKKLLRRSQGQVEAKEMKSGGRVASVWYRWVQAETPRSKYQYIPQADGSVLEVADH